MNKKIIIISVMLLFLIGSYGAAGININTQKNEDKPIEKNNIGALDSDGEKWLKGDQYIEADGDYQDVILIGQYVWNAVQLSDGSNFGSAIYEFNIWATEITVMGIEYVERGLPFNSGPTLYIYNYNTEKWEIIKENIADTDDNEVVLKNYDINHKDGYIKTGDSNTWDKVRLKVYAEEDWGWPIPVVGDNSYVCNMGIGYKKKPLVPDLEVDKKDFDFGEVKRGSTKSGVFQIKNVGDMKSKLNWHVKSYPDWGKWTLKPSYGNNILPDEPVEVEFEVEVPMDLQSYTGSIIIVNNEDHNDFEEITVSLISSKSREYTNQLLLKRIIDKFPLLQRLLNL